MNIVRTQQKIKSLQSVLLEIGSQINLRLNLAFKLVLKIKLDSDLWDIVSFTEFKFSAFGA